ncbi:ERV/ALR sulfhydryl oxidase domain-containing protein [Haematococcus lacustris]
MVEQQHPLAGLFSAASRQLESGQRAVQAWCSKLAQNGLSWEQRQRKQIWPGQQSLLQLNLPLASLMTSNYAQGPAGMMVVTPPPTTASPSTTALRKAELGRATWTLLHMLAAQYPACPTRQQKRDVKQFIDSLTRIYPCGECAQHFQEVVRRDPPQVDSQAALAQWTCRVHNVVNQRLQKPVFNCNVVGARWAALDCLSEDEEKLEQPRSACEMLGQAGSRRF